MSDAPIPPASAPPPPETASPKKRPWTILGRLSQAVREQNWFAVGLEVLIVIVGVVVGFQITAWGQDRSDAERETRYLLQLKADLIATQQVVARVDSVQAIPDRSTLQLLRAYYASEAPPLDSVNVWLFESFEFDVARPVLGTARALVSTGDLNLLRSDTLRSAITAYIDRNEWALRHQESLLDMGFASTQALHRRFDFASTLSSVFPPAVLDSIARAKTPLFIPVGLDRPPRPVDVDQFLRDDEARALLLEINVYQRNLRRAREEIQAITTELLVQLEAELDR